MKVLRIKSTTSTNDYVAKFIKKKQDITVICESQTAGKGTKGRSFSSGVGGIYLSRLKFYDNLLAKDAFSIIRDVSVAVVKTLRAFNVDAKIKWPNDILVNGKKICGILTENKVDGDKIIYSIVGLGINVENELPKELENIATTMKEILGEVNFEAVLMTLLFNLSARAEVGVYEGYSCVLGKKVSVAEGEKEYDATVEAILDDGRIRLADGRVLSSAEIKLKL